MVDAIGSAYVSAYTTFQRLSRADGDALLAKFQRQPTVQKEIEYFKQKAAQLKDPEELFKDRRLLRFIVSAYSLDDEINYPGRLRKVLESKIADPVSLANRMTDPRYREMANELMIGDMGVLNFGTTGFVDKLVKRYVTAEYEKDLGNQNPALREAAYFLRKIGTVKTSLEILGDRVLRDVVTYTLDLPPQIALQSIQKQQSLIDSRIDISLFGANGAAAIGSARSIDLAKQDVSAIDSTLAIASKAATQISTLVSRFQSIKDSYARLANIQNPSGPYAAEIPTQGAAVPGLTRQSGLLAAADKALGDVGTHLTRMDELLALARDPANAANLAAYKTEFAELRTKIQSAVAGATFTYDDGDADSVGTVENLLNGTLPSAISVQITSGGETVDIRTHDLSGMLTSIDAANTAFLAVTDASDTANLDAAQTSADSAENARYATSVTVAVDQNQLQEKVASVSQWAATLNTAQIYTGSQALRDAGARLTSIDSILSEIRSIAEESVGRAAGADRSDLTARYDELVAQIDSLVDNPNAGSDNLLAGSGLSYELLNGFYLQARGRDLNGSVVSSLTGSSLATAADAQALISTLDGTIKTAMTQASREISIDAQPFYLAANTLDPRAAVDSAYRTLSEEMESLVAGAAVNGTNLLDPFASDPKVTSQTSGQTLTVTALTTFDAQITQLLEAGAALLPSSANDASGALAKLNEAFFNTNRALSQLNGEIGALTLERSVAQAVIDASEMNDGSQSGPFEATDYALKFIQKYLLKKDQEGVQTTNLASLLIQPIGIGGSNNSGVFDAINSLAGRSRFTSFA